MTNKVSMLCTDLFVFGRQYNGADEMAGESIGNVIDEIRRFVDVRLVGVTSDIILSTHQTYDVCTCATQKYVYTCCRSIAIMRTSVIQ